MAQSKFVKIMLILANLFMSYMEALYKRFVPEERKSIRDKVSLLLQSGFHNKQSYSFILRYRPRISLHRNRFSLAICQHGIFNMDFNAFDELNRSFQNYSVHAKVGAGVERSISHGPSFTL